MKNNTIKTNPTIYIYSVFTDIYPELENFCKLNNITYSTEDQRTYEFTGTENNLQKLHNKFYNDYTFEIYTLN